jgi:pyroglutamyl-peptidase
MHPILVTGYAALPGRVNASQALIESLRTALPADLSAFRQQLHLVVLPLESQRIAATLQDALARFRPRLCVFTGQAPGRNRICFERVALNIKDFSEPDATGYRPQAEPIDPTGPAAYWSTLPAQETAVQTLREAGIPAAFSNHAGTYLCNQLLYEALHLCAQRGEAVGCGFVHIPALPEQLQDTQTQIPFMPLDMTRRAIATVLSLLHAQLQHHAAASVKPGR